MSTDPFDDSPTPEEKATDFFESGAASCRFTNIGDVHDGVILDFTESQQRDIKTGAKSFWPDGNPKMMLVVTLQTNERDPDIDDDDGQRRLYINKPSALFAAIMAAKGKHRFAVGGRLAVKYTKNGKPKTAGFNAPKEYAAKYTSPNGHAMEPVASNTASTTNTSTGAKIALHEAWEAYKAKNPGVDAVQIATAWKADVAMYFPGKAKDDISMAEWRRFIADGFEIKAATEPKFDEPAFADSDIPF